MAILPALRQSASTARCAACGYVAHPVSGFCPRCLAKLPAPALARLGFLLLGLIALEGALVLDVSMLRAANTPPPNASAAQAVTSPTRDLIALPAPTPPPRSDSAAAAAPSATFAGRELPDTSTDGSRINFRAYAGDRPGREGLARPSDRRP